MWPVPGGGHVQPSAPPPGTAQVHGKPDLGLFLKAEPVEALVPPGTRRVRLEFTPVDPAPFETSPVPDEEDAMFVLNDTGIFGYWILYQHEVHGHGLYRF